MPLALAPDSPNAPLGVLRAKSGESRRLEAVRRDGERREQRERKRQAATYDRA